MAEYGESSNPQVDRFLSSKNVADGMEEQKLNEIGEIVKKGFELDEMSRREWLEKVRMWMNLATQVMDKKSFPWPNAANIKYPLLATAAMQFAARAYPALVPSPELVKGVVKSKDPDGQQYERAKRVGRHMSYQIMCEMDGWEESMDKACLVLPIVGSVFKKTYYNPIKEKNVSELVTAENLVINYWSKCLEEAPRKTQLIQLTKNQVEERVRMELFLNVDLGEPVPYVAESVKDGKEQRTEIKQPSTVDDTTPYTFLECHTWYDMDGDGYSEPWIITIEHKSAKVVRIVPRFSLDGVKTSEDKKKIIRIEPDEYFTEFTFIPSPDGGIYGVGFGLLLGAINDAVNTLTNQLLDGGTLSNLQSGFLGRSLRIRGGAVTFQPGQWKQVDFTGDDIRKHILPLQFNPPSDVLFKLLEALVGSGKELASVANIMVGEMPGQNTPATTTMATIEQALKVFTAIHKRLYRSLTKEYEKLFKLNKIYFDKEEEMYFILNSSGDVEEAKILKDDYTDSVTVKPNADPNVVSDAQEMARAQLVMQLLETQIINPQEAAKRVLEAGKVQNIPALLNYQPPPDPKAQEMQMKMQMEQQKSGMKMQEMQAKMQLEQQLGQLKIQLEEMKIQLKQFEAQIDMQVKQQEGQMDMQMAEQNMAIKQRQGQQQIELGEQQFQMKKQQMTQQAQMDKQKAKEKQTSGQQPRSK